MLINHLEFFLGRTLRPLSHKLSIPLQTFDSFTTPPRFFVSFSKSQPPQNYNLKSAPCRASLSACTIITNISRAYTKKVIACLWKSLCEVGGRERLGAGMRTEVNETQCRIQ